MADDRTIAALDPEWRRVELLCGVLVGGRRGERPPDDVLDELADTAMHVAALREADAWAPVSGGGLTDVEHDLLALAAAPALLSRVAALVGNLTGGGPDAGAATPALAAELLSLPTTRLPDLAAALRPDAALRSRGLLRLTGEQLTWDGPLRPGPGVIETLLEVPDVVAAPPGSRHVPADGVVLDDLVVSGSVRARLGEFVTAVDNRGRMVAWSLGRPAGPIAMFSGPSGVGKSLAARAVAGQLGWPLFTVDLGALVSKYIGETEKNLNALFEAARGRELILHFEEAESIFGRRGEIKEARDRYANLEVSHLLSRLESHDGPCVLSTNLRRNIDPAFIRRFTSVVDFPRPDRGQRAELWRRNLPDGADDVDVEALAEVDLTGGQIRNAAVYASLVTDAPGEQATLRQGDAVLGIWRELGKPGRQVLPSDLGRLADELAVAELEAAP